jgi:hypothetical protein
MTEKITFNKFQNIENRFDGAVRRRPEREVEDSERRVRRDRDDRDTRRELEDAVRLDVSRRERRDVRVEERERERTYVDPRRRINAGREGEVRVDDAERRPQPKEIAGAYQLNPQADGAKSGEVSGSFALANGFEADFVKNEDGSYNFSSKDGSVSGKVYADGTGEAKVGDKEYSFSVGFEDGTPGFTVGDIVEKRPSEV